MGYRLDINKLNKGKLENVFYGTKLFGYHDESEFLSYMYLISIGKLEKNEYFDYGSVQYFALNKKEFTIFCYLYNIDMNKFYDYSDEKDVFINAEEIQKELLDEYDKECNNCRFKNILCVDEEPLAKLAQYCIPLAIKRKLKNLIERN